MARVVVAIPAPAPASSSTPDSRTVSPDFKMARLRHLRVSFRETFATFWSLYEKPKHFHLQTGTGIQDSIGRQSVHANTAGGWTPNRVPTIELMFLRQLARPLL